jgi:hypothetical protein
VAVKPPDIWAAGPLTSMASLFMAQLRVEMKLATPASAMQVRWTDDPATCVKMDETGGPGRGACEN